MYSGSVIEGVAKWICGNQLPAAIKITFSLFFLKVAVTDESNS